MSDENVNFCEISKDHEEFLEKYQYSTIFKIWIIDIIITDKIYSNQNYKMLGNTLPLTAQIQGFWSIWGLIRALSKCPLLNSHPVPSLISTKQTNDSNWS